MPLVGIKEILTQASAGGYGIPSLLGGSLEMALGPIAAAEEVGSPLILAFNEQVTPAVPMEVGMPMLVKAAEHAKVPVATILDHGDSLEAVLKAIRFGSAQPTP